MPLFDPSGNQVPVGALPARRPKLPQMIAANKFDPKASASSYVVPLDRLRQISQSWEQNPGRAIGGSGPTGLASNDSQGWARMLEEQQEYMKLADFASGKPQGINVRAGDLNERHIGGGIEPATGQNMGPLPGYGAPDDRNKVMGGLRGAYRPKQQPITSGRQNG